MRERGRCLFLVAIFILLPVWATAQANTHTDAPHIDGPRVYGARPNHPFLYRIPATSAKPLRFSAKGLPAGLKLDSATGFITGTVAKAGSFEVTLLVTSQLGSATEKFKIVIGDRLALTPPMGWSAWDFLQSEVSDKDVRAQATAMVSSGLADHGYSYINIDDGWEAASEGPRHTNAPARDAEGRILPNDRFPNMSTLTAFLHAKGLKAGLYTSPGPRTCGRFEGSLGHEQQDADQYAKWGFDFLKYDLCSYSVPNANAEAIQKPYAMMGKMLEHEDRDILFSISNGGGFDVPAWGREVGAQMWRTGDDLAWGPRGVYSTWDNIASVFQKQGLAKWAGPGGWNDPDDLVIGRIAYIPYNDVPPNVHIDRRMPPPLTPDEQLTQMSLWSLLSAPLIIGGDLTTLDSFSLEMLTNDEVIGVDQDPLGKPAAKVSKEGKQSIWVKEMEDGSRTVGLFNLGEREETMTLAWSEAGVAGSQGVRDLWKHEELGVYIGELKLQVPPHGVRLLQLTARSN